MSLPATPDPCSRHGLHLYTLLVDNARAPVDRDRFIGALHRRKIGTGVHYRSIPTYSVYQQRFGWKPDDYPVANAIGQSTVSLPLSARLSDEDVEDVVTAVRETLLAPSA